ncbi:Hypothetical_protein [Hexamita inflata]|uniref:Hypothetical_protein n=1 Tax=Hexamita inflata TaxID=28002 RepID=A0AA86UTA7_9EUKA|nr:Hypothetical protein HINF_LOCUS51511 [Hexamita inflata]
MQFFEHILLSKTSERKTDPQPIKSQPPTRQESQTSIIHPSSSSSRVEQEAFYERNFKKPPTQKLFQRPPRQFKAPPPVPLKITAKMTGQKIIQQQQPDFNDFQRYKLSSGLCLNVEEQEQGERIKKRDVFEMEDESETSVF